MPASTVALRARTLLALTILCSPLSLADVPVQAEAPVAEVKTLLHLNGSEAIVANLGHIMGQGAILGLHRKYPSVSQHTDTAVANAVESFVREHSSHDELIDLLVPIYTKYLSKSDVEGLIAFYKTPVGKKMAAVTPAISADSALAGQQWAASLGGGLQLRIRDVLREEKLDQQ